MKLFCVSNITEDGEERLDLPDELLTLNDQVIESGEVTLDGCPVICLHDSPVDVESLLYALYDGPYVYYIHPTHLRYH